MISSVSVVLPVVYLFFFFFFFFMSMDSFPTSAVLEAPALKGLHVGRPTVEVTPSPLSGPGTKEVFSCERVQISGKSRLELGSYANALYVHVIPSISTQERLHSRIQVCFQLNASLGLCQCEKEDWQGIHNGSWSSLVSPYENGYLDVKLTSEISDPITVSIVEEPQQWRFICLGMGFLLLLLAPIVSSWILFYYTSSMAIGVMLVVIALLLQGMKLLPTGGRNVFDVSFCGSILGAGSFLMDQFSMMVSALLINFGLREEMHNWVLLFLLVGAIISGAALGYWIVGEFVISEDGSVDVGIAQFLKWAMSTLAAFLILQSTVDTPLALGALFLCSSVCFLISPSIWRLTGARGCGSSSLNWRAPAQWSQRTTNRPSHAEFLARTPAMGTQSELWNRQTRCAAWLDSNVKGVVSSTAGARRRGQDYYSVFHKTLNRKFSEQEWKDSKTHWTRQAVSTMIASPEFSDWVIDHADRIRVVSSDSPDEACSESGSSEEVTTRRGSIFSRFSVW
ncbi:hypothetical protein SAY86_011771 [Trapa natans]|uniref:Uncharacterized protein n=1 Tax=Trapa natans TaxID=22666 RepID=A0AAN7R6Q6_TRANT|nr:hypothetical protein SAY86_011771 [Trapa natans]